MLSRSRRFGRQASASVEFALIAPMLITMMIGVWDITRVLMIRQQLTDAAEAVVQAAEKLSISTTTKKTSLTPAQMQNAMSTIYAIMPGLALGSGSGPLTGAYGVTLSGVVFWPLCQLAAGCTPETTLTQTPYTLWSSYLTEGGPQLSTGFVQRACGALASVSQFPDDNTQLTKMINPNAAGGSGIILPPQVVADLYYDFTPTFSWFLQTVRFWTSATLPSSSGGTDQEITYNGSASTAVAVMCTVP